jgi:hypothetical protein
MLRGQVKVFVGRQESQVVPNAQLNEQRVNGADLNTPPAAGISNFGCLNVVIAIWLQEAQRSKSFNKLVASLGPGEALKEFLKYQARCEDLIASLKGLPQHLHFGNRAFGIPSECE